MRGAGRTGSFMTSLKRVWFATFRPRMKPRDDSSIDSPPQDRASAIASRASRVRPSSMRGRTLMAAIRDLAAHRDPQSAEERTSPSPKRAELSRNARIPSQSCTASRVATQARRRVMGGNSGPGSATRSGKSRRGRPAAVR